MRNQRAHSGHRHIRVTVTVTYHPWAAWKVETVFKQHFEHKEKENLDAKTRLKAPNNEEFQMEIS